MLIFSKAKLIFKDEDFIFQGLPALRYRVDWLPQTEEKQVVSLYQIQVADKNRKNLYIISFTALKGGFRKIKASYLTT